ncbi:MAG: cysteine--tRNA ligase [Candidatus Omnitrophica bacterium]|nr:cysteine--tRNA ligase [Candidatus Omnitrophota bacterium]MBU1928600.1 cysteine--tRNA ligase [Candidatus Omnitrophota bacterium]MBU2034613.1 cysteine--tRNA ligase [Candidatus Omnitrophota bacterium]MBU2221138.1 cysteine--tRNA ligase [Candidatus Omnitrophota bacterium]MBU2258429.1 cysteine--tRNA ligase [Candidatus Omnitrophota bacterium]
MHIYNSLTRRKEEFKSLRPQEVKMYVCGPTVYDQPHIGHARSAYIFDVIRRYLAFRGYKVIFVRNVTDVDDKIIDKARKEFPGEDLNTAFKKVADKYLIFYHRALESLGIGRAQDKIFEPKASDYISKMIVFIQGLVDKQVAYVCAGDVYFDITKAKNYGKLSNQAPDKMESGVRVSAAENKRNPLDFALWKSAKENEPSWDSPFGKGRPGWHIECSVMSLDILGDEFDIHGGGVDLIFPHHENEIAQSEGLGKKFARYWIHHGLLTINSQKMAKSLGNFITVQDFLDKHKNTNLLKLLFLSTHYSHPVDYTEEKIKEAEQAVERISILLGKIDKCGVGCKAWGLNRELSGLENKFIEAMDDDFNMPQALACIFELVNTLNKNIEDYDFVCQGKDLLFELSGILGLEWKKTSEDKSLSAEEKALIDKRNTAKKERNFAEADKIRKDLEAKGIILEDTKDGTVWRRRGLSP